MKKLLLTSIAALLLATGAVHATGPDYCAVVSKISDAFLNVRKAPTMKSEIIAKIHPGDLVHADAYECLITDDCEIKNWTHIDSVLRSSGPEKPQELRGWVSSKFLKGRPELYSTCTGLGGRGNAPLSNDPLPTETPSVDTSIPTIGNPGR